MWKDMLKKDTVPCQCCLYPGKQNEAEAGESPAWKGVVYDAAVHAYYTMRNDRTVINTSYVLRWHMVTSALL